jgi:hypothetical protein
MAAANQRQEHRASKRGEHIRGQRHNEDCEAYTGKPAAACGANLPRKGSDVVFVSGIKFRHSKFSTAQVFPKRQET